MDYLQMRALQRHINLDNVTKWELGELKEGSTIKIFNLPFQYVKWGQDKQYRDFVYKVNENYSIKIYFGNTLSNNIIFDFLHDTDKLKEPNLIYTEFETSHYDGLIFDLLMDIKSHLFSEIDESIYKAPVDYKKYLTKDPVNNENKKLIQEIDKLFKNAGYDITS